MDTAFTSNTNGLSVIKNDDLPPRTALEHWLGIERQRLKSKNDKDRNSAKRKLSKNGETVDALYASGWRVAKLALSEFTSRDVVPSSEVDQYGHFNLEAQSPDTFSKYSQSWADAAVIVGYDETIA